MGPLRQLPDPRRPDPALVDAGKEVTRMSWYPLRGKGPFSPFPTLLLRV